MEHTRTLSSIFYLIASVILMTPSSHYVSILFLKNRYPSPLFILCFVLLLTYIILFVALTCESIVTIYLIIVIFFIITSKLLFTEIFTLLLFLFQ